MVVYRVKYRSVSQEVLVRAADPDQNPSQLDGRSHDFSESSQES
jgi:hypothetical protein